MNVLLLWNLDREDGWLLGRISLIVKSNSVEDAIEELQSVFFTLGFVRKYLRHNLDEEIDEQVDDGDIDDVYFSLDKVEYRNHVVCFDFKNNEGDRITVKRNQSDIIITHN